MATEQLDREHAQEQIPKILRDKLDGMGIKRGNSILIVGALLTQIKNSVNPKQSRPERKNSVLNSFENYLYNSMKILGLTDNQIKVISRFVDDNILDPMVNF